MQIEEEGGFFRCSQIQSIHFGSTLWMVFVCPTPLSALTRRVIVGVVSIGQEIGRLMGGRRTLKSKTSKMGEMERMGSDR